MTSKYGKSAVDATRRNMLPLYLDETIEELKYNTDLIKTSLFTLGIVLEQNNWIEEKDSQGEVISYRQAIPFDLEKDDGILTIFPDSQNSIEYARAQINCSFNKEQLLLVFTAINKPSKDLRVLALAIGPVLKNTPVAEYTKF